jgi:hypothetical protein
MKSRCAPLPVSRNRYEGLLYRPAERRSLLPWSKARPASAFWLRGIGVMEIGAMPAEGADLLL